jgi:putative heme-binding domain-containing protein
VKKVAIQIGLLIGAATLVTAFWVAASAAYSPLVSVNWQNGDWLFRYRCASCHSVGESRIEDYGPNLARIGADAASRVPGMTAEQFLIQSIVDPNAYRRPGVTEVMPARVSADLSREDIVAIVGYLMSLNGEPNYRRLAGLMDTIQVPKRVEGPRVSAREAEAGRQLFLARCNECHTLRRLPGTDLRAPVMIGTGNHELDYLTESIVQPSKTIVRGYETWTVALRSGLTVTGRLMRDAPDVLVILSVSSSGVLEAISIPRGDIALDDQGKPRMRVSTISSMPENLLTEQEVKLVVTFLRTL